MRLRLNDPARYQLEPAIINGRPWTGREELLAPNPDYVVDRHQSGYDRMALYYGIRIIHHAEPLDTRNAARTIARRKGGRR